MSFSPSVFASTHRARRLTWLTTAIVVIALLVISSVLTHRPAHATHALQPMEAAGDAEPSTPVLHRDRSLPTAKSVFEKQSVLPEELPATF